LQRQHLLTSSRLWDDNNEYKSFEYIFNGQNVHEEATYTFIEKFTSDVSDQTYTHWYVDICGDASNNNLDTLSWDITVITPQYLTASSSINNVLLFDLSAASNTPTDTVWENKSQDVNILAGSMVFHEIKVSAYIDPDADWPFPDGPLEGHEIIFQRKTSEDVSYGWSSDLSYQNVKHIFKYQNIHEEQTYSMIETIPNAVNYTHWKCDISGAGVRTNNLDKLTWKMIVITPSEYITTVHGEIFDLSKNFHDLSSTYYDLSALVSFNITDISDVSGLVFDLSKNFHDLSSEYDAFKENVKTNDLSVNNISNNSGNNVRFLTDVSFNNDVTIKGDLIIDGSFNFNDVIHNITTVNNELLISTQLDICNQGTGPALEVTQIGSGNTNDVALFKYSGTDKAFEIKANGVAIFYEDVSFIGKIIGDISNEDFNDLSKNFHDLSSTYYDLSALVSFNITDISDVSGIVFDLSKNFHDLSATYYDLSALVSFNITDISDVSGLVFDLSKNFHDTGAGTNCLSSTSLTVISNQNMNATKTTYTWAGGGDGVYLETGSSQSTSFECAVKGYYLVNVLLWSTAGVSNNRSLLLGYVSVLSVDGISHSEIKRYHFGNSYYRDDNDSMDDTVLSGSTLVFLTPTDYLQIVSEVAYRQGTGANNADTTKCQLYIEYTGMK
jgi:hypothetical protein